MARIEHDIRITRARSALITRAPFYGALALSLELVEDNGADVTMWTDGTRLGYSRAFMDTCNEAEILGVVVHEVSHVAYKHHVRRQHRDAKRWNYAADYAINRDITAQGFKLPAGALLDPQYDGMSAEQIYNLLPAGAEKRRGGAGFGEVRDAAKAGDAAGMAAADQATDVMIRQAIGVAKRAAGGAGNLPAAITNLIAEMAAAQVDWREVFKRFVDSQNKKNFTWMVPNRRHAHSGLILPSTMQEGAAHIGFAIDTSGSMSKQAVAQIAGELQSALDEGACDRVTVVFCNTAVQGSATYERGEIINPVPAPRGGTAFAPAFKWFADNAPDVTAIVYCTDLDCGSHGDEPECPVMWAAYGHPAVIAQRFARAPFGELIELTPDF